MSDRMINENSVPYKDDVQRLQSLRTQIVLWLVVLALGIVLIPLMLISSWVRNDITRLETELLSVQSDVSMATNPSQDVVKLNNDIANINQLITLMQTVTVPSGLNWPQIVDAVAQYDTTTIELDSLTQADNVGKLRITGRALSNDAVVRYQQNLFVTGAFKDVIVLSMSTLPPKPTPVPSEDEATEAAAGPFGNIEFVIDLAIGASAP